MIKKTYDSDSLKDFKETVSEINGPYNYQETAAFLDITFVKTQSIIEELKTRESDKHNLEML